MLPSIRTRKFFVTPNGHEIPLENVIGVGWDIEGPYVLHSNSHNESFTTRLTSTNVELFDHLLSIIKNRAYRKESEGK